MFEKNRHTDGQSPQFLIVDTDPWLRQMAQRHLQTFSAGLTFAKAAADIHALAGRIDVALLSIGTFDAELLEAVRSLRQRHHTGIFMMTEVDAAEARMIALELGADDCMSPGFDEREVLARIGAILRRVEEMRRLVRTDAPTSPPTNVALLRFGGFRYDRHTRWLVRPDGTGVTLTPTEGDLLAILGGQAGRVIAKRDISRALYGRDDDPEGRSINMLVKRLRAKLEPDGNPPRWLRTVRNVGYCLDDGDEKTV